MSDRGYDTGTDASRSHRRTFLAAAGGAGTALLAGCTDSLSGGGLLGETGEGDGSPNGSSNSTQPTPEGEHEADVVGLLLQGSGSNLAFEVTVQNRGETGHVDWWQVERADQTVGNDDPIVRQELQVTDRETATKTVGSLDADLVVVRAHHSEGGYGGKAIVTRPSEGRLALVWQGKDPAPQQGYSFDSGD